MQKQILCGEWLIQTVRRRDFYFCDKFMLLNLEEQNKATEDLNQSGCLNLCVV